MAVERGAVTVDGEQRTSVAGVSAIGDCAGGFQLAHKAMHEGVIAVEAIAGRIPHPLDPRLVTRTTYCTPQIASIGLSEAEAREAGHDVGVGVFPFRGNARAVVWGETGGFTKVVADSSTNSVLGVHIIGHEVTELIYGPGARGAARIDPIRDVAGGGPASNAQRVARRGRDGGLRRGPAHLTRGAQTWQWRRPTR